MSIEKMPGFEQESHPGDVFFEKLGLSHGFGDIEIKDFKGTPGRTILRKDYFFQPDVNPLAKMAYEKLSAIDENDPRFPALRDAFLAGAAPYLEATEP